MQHHRNLRIPDTLADTCHPDRLALIVYDMQVGVVGQLADGPQVTEKNDGDVLLRHRLLPQPYGFECLGLVGVVLPPDDPASTEGPYLDPPPVEWNAAALSATTFAHDADNA
jgi:hypothetical protein